MEKDKRVLFMVGEIFGYATIMVGLALTVLLLTSLLGGL